VSRRRWYLLAALFAGMVVAAIATPSERRWLAGDSHILLFKPDLHRRRLRVRSRLFASFGV
jgi:hypothetical protein